MYNNLHDQKNESMVNKFFSSFTATIGVMGWAIVLFILGLIDSAKPPKPTFIETSLKLDMSPPVWNYKLLSDAWILIIVLALLSSLSFIFKLTICKNRFGATFFSLLFLLISSIFGIFLFQMRF